MCGIAGVIEFDSQRPADQAGLQRMAQALVHRGPDAEGIYQTGSVGLAHRRLSIIDLASGQQPMHSPDGQVSLIFIGEIYNYRELRVELQQAGHHFRTRSDTEVLLSAYLHYGLDAFAKLNGMLAAAVWDARTQQLVLVRDRFGKKPLFYYQDEQRFVFGSEIKALLAYGGIDRRLNPAALHEYLTYSYVISEQTVLEGIRRVPPAHVLVLDNNLHNKEVTCRPYWEFQFQPNSNVPDENEAEAQLETLLHQAVERRMISDVPLGAFLSGGIDSSLVVAMMAQSSPRPVQTFTIGFNESDYSEIEDARIVARHLGTDHHEMIVQPSALEILPDLVQHFDEPFGDSSAVPTYYVCQAARQHVTVALSGDGGDEVFAGYTRYQDLQHYQYLDAVPNWLRHLFIKPMARVLPFSVPGWNYLYALGSLSHRGFSDALVTYPYIHDKLYTPEFKALLRGVDAFAPTAQLLEQTKHLDPVSQYQYLDTCQYLPADILTKVDRMSMAHSLEVRAPFLDAPWVEYVASLPVSYKLRDGVSKYLLRKICKRLLPPAVLSKPKQGFALPKADWFQQDLWHFAAEVLLETKTRARGYVRPAAVKQLLDQHATGRRDYSAWIWSLLVLELWCRTCLDSEPVQTGLAA